MYQFSEEANSIKYNVGEETSKTKTSSVKITVEDCQKCKNKLLRFWNGKN